MQNNESLIGWEVKAVDRDTVIVNDYLVLKRIMSSTCRNGDIVISKASDNEFIDLIEVDDFMAIAKHFSTGFNNFLYTPHANEYGDPLNYYSDWVRIFEYEGKTGDESKGREIAERRRRTLVLIDREEALGYYTLNPIDLK